MAKKREAVKLPKERSVRASSLQEHSILIYGREKIGKTTLAAEFPDAFFLMCEPGGKDLEIFQAPISDWSDFLGYLRALEKSKRFQTVVVDTADLAYKLCEQYCCRKLGIDHPSEEDWGKGWGAVRDEFTSAMVRLQNSGRGLLLLSHEREKEFKRKDGSKTHRIGPSMPNGATTVLEPMVDIFAHYDYEGKKRVLTIRGDDFITAGTRLTTHFVGVEEVRLGNSPEEAYAAFVAAYETTTSKRTAKQKAVALQKKGASKRRVVRR